MSDNDISAADSSPDQYLYDLRAVHDIGNLRLEPGVDGSERQWSVLRVAPEPYSGSATLIGGAIDGTTGKLIEASTGKFVTATALRAGVIEQGSWGLITRIGAPRGKQRGRYKWTEPLASDKRKLEPDDVYQPFSKGGVILCKHDPQAEGTAQFDSVSLLPPGWESFVRPAFEMLRKNSALFAAPSAQSRKDSLRAMMQDKNSIVATIAFRALAESGGLNAEILHEVHTKSTGYRRAVITYIALLNSGVVGESAIEKELTQSIASTRRQPDSRPVALALAAFALFHPDLASARTLSLKLLGAVRGQSVRSLFKVSSDPYTEQLLKMFQLP